MPQSKLEFFNTSKSTALTIVPITVDDAIRTAVAGPTFPWKNKLIEKGFKYTTNHNGENVALWVSNDTLDDNDIDELVNDTLGESAKNAPAYFYSLTMSSADAATLFPNSS